MIMTAVNEGKYSRDQGKMERSLSLEWGNLAYREFGDHMGIPVVFIHAMSFDQEIWQDVMSLAPAGYRLISLDLRGHGKSDLPPLPYRVEDYAADVTRLLEHLQVGACCLVGVSFGGMVAQAIASLHPDLIEQLVLSNTATKIGDFDEWMVAAEEARDFGFTRENTMSGLQRLFSEEFLDSSPLVESLVQRRMDRCVEGYIGCCHAIAHADLSESSKQLDQPTLVIGSDQDSITPPDVVERLATTIPNSSLALISGAGHLPCVDAPDTFAELMFGFLRT
ncbi:alpha/beta fold hydrolase [uncultured Tateyamaria sp.]|uniref:alpha/beta fold hydrolase n=1 Tax=uncultured Tateyamaria sp. TaxID=455651 RepID=UPI0026297FF7|nr:alpha/beta fold hydrolase [uncultured Tateyamaria sp.]